MSFYPFSIPKSSSVARGFFPPQGIQSYPPYNSAISYGPLSPTRAAHGGVIPEMFGPAPSQVQPPVLPSATYGLAQSPLVFQANSSILPSRYTPGVYPSTQSTFNAFNSGFAAAPVTTPVYTNGSSVPYTAQPQVFSSSALPTSYSMGKTYNASYPVVGAQESIFARQQLYSTINSASSPFIGGYPTTLSQSPVSVHRFSSSAAPQSQFVSSSSYPATNAAYTTSGFQTPVNQLPVSVHRFNTQPEVFSGSSAPASYSPVPRSYNEPYPVSTTYCTQGSAALNQFQSSTFATTTISSPGTQTQVFSGSAVPAPYSPVRRSYNEPYPVSTTYCTQGSTPLNQFQSSHFTTTISSSGTQTQGYQQGTNTFGTSKPFPAIFNSYEEYIKARPFPMHSTQLRQ